MTFQHIDFTVVSEPWNKYQLDDGAELNFRFIVTRFRKEIDDKTEEDIRIDLMNQIIIALGKIPEHLMGEPSPSPELNEENLIKDTNFDVLKEGWNEYVLTDGTNIRIKASVIRVIRSDKYDKNGEPIYKVETSQQIIAKKQK